MHVNSFVVLATSLKWYTYFFIFSTRNKICTISKKIDASLALCLLKYLHNKNRFHFPPFSTFENACTKSGIWQFLSIRFWCVLSLDFAMWLGTFRFDFPLSSVFLWFYLFQDPVSPFGSQMWLAINTKIKSQKQQFVSY